MTADTPLHFQGFDRHIPVGHDSDQVDIKRGTSFTLLQYDVISQNLRKKSKQKEANLRMAESCSVYRRLCLWECQGISTSEGFQEYFQP